MVAHLSKKKKKKKEHQKSQKHFSWLSRTLFRSAPSSVVGRSPGTARLDTLSPEKKFGEDAGLFQRRFLHGLSGRRAPCRGRLGSSSWCQTPCSSPCLLLTPFSLTCCDVICLQLPPPAPIAHTSPFLLLLPPPPLPRLKAYRCPVAPHSPQPPSPPWRTPPAPWPLLPPRCLPTRSGLPASSLLRVPSKL